MARTAQEREAGAPERSRTPNPQIRRLGRSVDPKGVRLNGKGAGRKQDGCCRMAFVEFEGRNN